MGFSVNVLIYQQFIIGIRVSPFFWGLEKIPSPPPEFSMKKASDFGGAGDKRNFHFFFNSGFRVCTCQAKGRDRARFALNRE